MQCFSAAQLQEITCCGAQCQETVINFVSATAPATSHPGLLAHRVSFYHYQGEAALPPSTLPTRDLLSGVDADVPSTRLFLLVCS